METINKEDAALYVDVTCLACKRRMALSNAYEIEGAYYCEKHIPSSHKAFIINLMTGISEADWIKNNQALKDLLENE